MSIFKDANKALDLAKSRKEFQKMQEDRKLLIEGIGKELVAMMSPMMDKTLQRLVEKFSVTINPPAVNVPQPKVTVTPPTVNVPTPRVTVESPRVTVPEIKIPKLNWPEGEMPIKGWVQLMGVDLANPLPVQLRDADGKPLSLVENLTQVISSGGGGARVVKISNDSGSPVPVTGSFSASITADYGEGEIGTNTLRTVQATDAIASVNVRDAFGSTAVGSVFNADNRIRVSVETGGSGLTDSELRASSVPVAQASGAVWSTYVTGFGSSVAAYQLDGDGNYRSTFPTSETNSVAIKTAVEAIEAGQLPDGHNVTVDNASIPVTQSGTWNINNVSGTISLPTGAATAANQQTDALTDTELRASSVPVAQASGAIWSTVATPIAVRGGRYSAYATTTTGVETTLISAQAGYYLDLIQITGANQSDSAQTIDIRAVSGGNVIISLTIPAESTAGIATSAPIPQDNQGNAWTIQNNGSDVSNTSIDVSALFVRE